MSAVLNFGQDFVFSAQLLAYLFDSFEGDFSFIVDIEGFKNVS